MPGNVLSTASFNSPPALRSVPDRMALQPDQLAEKLRSWRGPRTREWAVEQIRQHGKVSIRQYDRWEGGEQLPHWSSIESIAAAMGVDPLEFVSEVSNQQDGFASRLERVESGVDEILTLLRETLPPLAALLEAQAATGRSAGSSARKRRAS